MIDRHYGHLAHDSREHAVALLGALALERAVDAAWTSHERPARPLNNTFSRTPAGRRRRLVDAQWTPRPGTVASHATMRTRRQQVATGGYGFGLIWRLPGSEHFAKGCHLLRPLCSIDAPSSRARPKRQRAGRREPRASADRGEPSSGHRMGSSCLVHRANRGEPWPRSPSRGTLRCATLIEKEPFDRSATIGALAQRDPQFHHRDGYDVSGLISSFARSRSLGATRISRWLVLNCLAITLA